MFASNSEVIVSDINMQHGVCHYRHPLVSVVIPCYNAEEYVGECIASVVKQDYPNLEIVIVDDASTDDSVSKIIPAYTGIVPRRFIKNVTNLGECKTSQKGFDAARGKYVCRLSADDAFVNYCHISRQVEEMDRYDLDWCYNSISRVGTTVGESKITQTAWCPIPIRHAADLLHVLDNAFLKFPIVCYLIAGVRNPINSSALMFRKTTFDKWLSWDSGGVRSVCDGVLISDILRVGLKGRAIPMLGAFYRIHPQQATGKPDTNKCLADVRCRIYSDARLPLWARLCSKMIKVLYDIR